MKLLSTLTIAIALAATASFASAQEGAHASHDAHAAHAGHQASAPAELTEGEVRKIDKETGKITLRHGELKNLNMAAMTMVFRVKDPGWYKHPAGTVAREWKGEAPAAVRSQSTGGQAMPAVKPADVELKVRKPTGHQGHH